MKQHQEDEVRADAEDSGVHEPLPQQEDFWRPPARFGSVPVEAEPLGWDRQRGFQKHYPRVDLPTQIIERVKLGNSEPHEPNRLIWGDNLHVMRQMPSNSIDVIYIDPPFFSGRQYNVMWGDANEVRSFNDIWEGGMPGYLIWLNARLYEMKRLLKPTGSIYVHCDWHASHYIKVEMDKIFGHENFRNEVVWYYDGPQRPSRKDFADKHDVLFRFTKSGKYRADSMGFNVISDSELREKYKKSEDGKWYYDLPRGDYSDESISRLEAEGRIRRTRTGTPRVMYFLQQNDAGEQVRQKVLHDVWTDVVSLGAAGSSREKIGYPTQKPESLLERVIDVSSEEGETVADFFVGGGTTAAVAQRLGRRFIGCDQSRVAVAVTAERLKQQAIIRGIEDAPIPDFTVEHWGVYEADRLSEMLPEEFRAFVLRAYGATRIGDEEESSIFGWRNQLPIWVGGPDLDSQVTASDVLDFSNAIRRTAQYRDASLRDGIMLAWGFREDAREAADDLRQREHVDVNFVRLSQVRIGDADFREHIVGRSTDRADYSEFLTFVQPPVVSVAFRANGGKAVTFDAGDSAVVNAGAEIVNLQWDFNYDGKRFTATQGYSFQRDKNRRPQLRVTHKFERTGEFRVACRIQDSRGGEGAWTGNVTVK